MVRRPGGQVDARTEAYGALDEAGVGDWESRARCAAPGQAELAADILRLQNDLFIAGAELATAPEAAGGSRTG